LRRNLEREREGERWGERKLGEEEEREKVSVITSSVF